MYYQYFHLSENPFSITPNPRFLFLSEQHRDALAHLLYGMGEGAGGFVQLTGEVGAGKTTLCRSILNQVPESVDAALIFNPNQSAFELVASTCDELQVEYPKDCKSIKVLTDLLNRRLLEAHAQGRRTVLIIDEAQNLSPETLEQLRLLTNLETATQKLLQIILIGQPELDAITRRNDLRQLSQRITARYHLKPLRRHETAAYISHRLKVVGAGKQLFTDGAVRRIHRLSGGIPRIINIICDRALLGAFALEKKKVNAGMVKKAAAEVLGQPLDSSRNDRSLAFAGLLLLTSLVAIGPWIAQQLLKNDAQTLNATAQPESKPAALTDISTEADAKTPLPLPPPLRVEEFEIPSEPESVEAIRLEPKETTETTESPKTETAAVSIPAIPAFPLLKQGAVGPEVQRLKDLMNRIDGASTDSAENSNIFDWTLKRRIVNFQKSRGLKPDGIVGSETFTILTLAAEHAPEPAPREEPITATVIEEKIQAPEVKKSLTKTEASGEKPMETTPAAGPIAEKTFTQKEAPREIHGSEEETESSPDKGQAVDNISPPPEPVSETSDSGPIDIEENPLLEEVENAERRAKLLEYLKMMREESSQQ